MGELLMKCFLPDTHKVLWTKVKCMSYRQLDLILNYCVSIKHDAVEDCWTSSLQYQSKVSKHRHSYCTVWTWPLVPKKLVLKHKNTKFSEKVSTLSGDGDSITVFSQQDFYCQSTSSGSLEIVFHFLSMLYSPLFENMESLDIAPSSFS